jgi:hypothetical protein
MKKIRVSPLVVIFLITLSTLLKSENADKPSEKHPVNKKKLPHLARKRRASKKSLKKSFGLRGIKKKPSSFSKNKRSQLQGKNKKSPDIEKKSIEQKQIVQSTQIKEEAPKPESPNKAISQEITPPQKNEENTLHEEFKKKLVNELDKEIEKIDQAYNYFKNNLRILEMPNTYFTEFATENPEIYTTQIKEKCEEAKKATLEKLSPNMTAEKMNKEIEKIVSDIKNEAAYVNLRDAYLAIHTDKEKQTTLLNFFITKKWME